MLELAIESKLPLITIQTDDTVNVGSILGVVAGKKAALWSPTLKTPIAKGSINYVLFTDKLNYKSAYQTFSDKEASLVVVNPPVAHSGAFDAGVLTTPPEMIHRFVITYGGDKHHEGLMAALAGLSYEQVFQISKMAMAKHGEYTPRAVRDIRRTFFGTVRGLQMLSTEFFFYQPAPTLQKWLSGSGRFLTEFDEPLLTPRGLLFNGPPGTGKTMGAKYLARELDLPLYHLDVASLMEKYVGESENNLRIALKQAETSAPCIMLIDEVEKLFHGGSDDSGVTSRMLSSILWWLQEHKAKVFTVMTTNKEAAIPPELYRPGRIDGEINFTTMKIVTDGFDFMARLVVKLEKETGIKLGTFDANQFPKPEYSHAELTQFVMDRLKTNYLKIEKEGEL